MEFLDNSTPTSVSILVQDSFRFVLNFLKYQNSHTQWQIHSADDEVLICIIISKQQEW
jgi:hypothetical protein